MANFQSYSDMSDETHTRLNKRVCVHHPHHGKRVHHLLINYPITHFNYFVPVLLDITNFVRIIIDTRIRKEEDE